MMCDCDALQESFHLLSTSLLLYLDSLQFCGCEALKAECDEKRFDITSFFSLVYEKICEPQKFNASCIGNASSLNHETQRQCGQINQYKRGVAYDEYFIPWSPFCRTYGFGVSKDVYDQDPTVTIPYENMPSHCQRATIFSIIVFYILCMAIIIANLTVLLVVRSDQYFHTAYGYFKASIAFADLIVGVIVIPAIIYLFHEESFTPKEFLTPGTFPSHEKEYQFSFFVVAGFSTVLSLAVSVYCLAASSLDRYYSISQPFRYKAKKFFTRKRSLVVIVCIWILSAIFGCFPLMSPYTTYAMVSATFVLATSPPSTSRQIVPFDWLALFNASSTEENVATVIPSTSFLNASQTNKSVPVIINTKPESIESTTLASISKQENEYQSSERAIYIILAMYLLSLIVPLIIVWALNICTIKAYRKRTENLSLRRNQSTFSTASKSTILSFLRMTSITSVSSINSTNADEMTTSKDDQQTALPTQNSAFLTVPIVRTRKHSTMPPNHLPSIDHVIQSDDVLQQENPKTVKTKIKTKSRRSSESSIPKRMQKVLLRMVIAFTVCLLPAICTLVFNIVLSPYTDVFNIERFSVEVTLYRNAFAYVSSVFLFGNSFVNCIIYTVLGKRFRDVSRGIYTGKITTMRKKLRRISIVIDSSSFPKQFSIRKKKTAEGTV